MKIILTRHGETEENVKHISQGQSHGTLTKKGIDQAKKLGLRFKDTKIDAIYSSDLGRAVNSIKEVAKYHPHLEVNYTQLLRERDLKKCCGMQGREIDWYDETGKIESGKDLEKRAKKFLDEVYEKHKKDTILVLSHGGIIAAMLAVILGKRQDEIFLMAEWENTNVTVLEINEDKSHKIHLLNCTQHLEQNT